MAKTLTFAGNNLLPQYVTNSVKITEHIQNKSNVMRMEVTVKSGQTTPQEGSEVVYKDGARFLFGGFVSRTQPTETGEGELFNYEVEVSDYSYIFNSKVARRAYTNKTLEFIVEDLLSAYVDSSYGFTTTNVQTGPTIDSISFDHVSIRKCFEKLAKLTGYVWWVDYQKNLYFQDVQTDAAPETITDSSANFESITIDYDTSQVRNSVIVIGSSDGEQSASSTTETFTGDGETRSWELEDKPSQVVTITVNGVNQQFSLDLNERDTDDMVYSFTDQRIYMTDAATTPANGHAIVITYFPRVPIIAQKQDAASIAFFAALDGGDGVMEYTIKESSIQSKAEANERAVQELDEFADPLATGIFKTRSGLLTGGSIFQPGQYLTVNLPTYGINTDTAFLIQQVDIEMVEDEENTTTEYFYTVRFGGRLVGVQEFLESLASEGEEVQDSNLILTIEQVVDPVEMDDGTPTMTKYTGNFEYGPGGDPQAVWNQSEWA